MSPVYDALRALMEWLAGHGALPNAFFLQFVANAVMASLLIGPLLGVLGTMVVVKRMAFFSQAIGNAALTGVSIGVLLGESNTSPYISMFGFCLIFGVVLRYTQQRTSLSSDVLIGVFLSISLAIGASLLLFVSARMNTHVLENIMFGSILTVNYGDLDLLGVVFFICMTLGGTFYNQMLLGSISPSLAEVRGAQVRVLEYAFVVLITIVTVACVKIVGAVLVEALLVVPAAAARNVSRSLREFVGYSVLFSTASCMLGIVMPMQFNIPIPSGGAIILVAAALFAVTAVLRNALGGFRVARPA
ncbi:metal ABC transporter permease [Alsobacter sp. SYSU M60028]|uniref:Metal ABC transporter permease n=1 Tax=Alsobacter ponti TaxID=2962936 RepID=A0ABT1L6A4_9HYPH|nr:metal ABC transporter permease [Alsobacter ponti]MCP8936912.1 metal ABC transporter permease [Alsobacter ponti]